MNRRKIRLFIAVDLPQLMREGLYGYALKLKPHVQGLRPALPQNIHLTLKFLGYIEENLLPGIKTALDKSVAGLPEIRADLSEIKAFPNFNSPRILWIGVGKGLEAIGKIKDNVDRGLLELGMPKDEKAFQAHITIARLKHIKKDDKANFAQVIKKTGLDVKDGFLIKDIHLYQSTLTSKGPIYTKLHSAAF